MVSVTIRIGSATGAPLTQQHEHAGQHRVWMAAHRSREAAICHDQPVRTDGEGKGDIEGVVGRMIDGQRDLQRDVLQPEVLAVVSRRSTGTKYLIDPSRDRSS